MLKAPQILVRTLVLGAGVAALAGCGQKGPLMLPTGPAAVGRATLPQTLRPRVLGGGPAAPEATTSTPQADKPARVAPPTAADLVPSAPPDTDSTLPLP